MTTLEAAVSRSATQARGPNLDDDDPATVLSFQCKRR